MSGAVVLLWPGCPFMDYLRPVLEWRPYFQLACLTGQQRVVVTCFPTERMSSTRGESANITEQHSKNYNKVGRVTTAELP